MQALFSGANGAEGTHQSGNEFEKLKPWFDDNWLLKYLPELRGRQAEAAGAQISGYFNM